MSPPSWAPRDVDVSRPSVARVYDYYLGGSHNLSVDRAMAREAIELWPALPQIMQANRAFLRRAVRYLISQGVTQFLDIGSGIPTVGNVHEVAQAASPTARVVYVDVDPVAVAVGKEILAGDERTDVVLGDLLDVDGVLNAPETARLLDLSQPVGVLMVALLHFVPPESDPGGVIARYRDALAPGSHLVISHASHEGEPDRADTHTALYQRSGSPMTMRSRDEIRALFDGFELVEPGLVFLPLWHPEEGSDPSDRPERFTAYAGAGRL